MNAYSKDLRLRVLAAVDRGTLRKEVVRLFGVSLATVATPLSSLSYNRSRTKLFRSKVRGLTV